MCWRVLRSPWLDSTVVYLRLVAVDEARGASDCLSGKEERCAIRAWH